MKHIVEIFDKQIYNIISPNIAALLRNIPLHITKKITEIRMRIAQPLLIVLENNDIMLQCNGEIAAENQAAYYCTREDLERTMQLICRNSLYAFAKELQQGFITIPGGHRVGLAGQVVGNDGKANLIKTISSINIRVAKEIIGCANSVLPYIIDRKKRISNTLIISPPRCGKTTVLRDLVRQISNGTERTDIHKGGMQVGVVDERSEIAACQNGVPTLDIGIRTDVLDSCSKSYGMLMLIRSMSPQVIATDEIGSPDDVYALLEALNAGISIIATAHGGSTQELLQRPYIKDVVKHNFFERYILLGNNPTIGTVTEVFSGKLEKLL